MRFIFYSFYTRSYGTFIKECKGNGYIETNKTLIGRKVVWQRAISRFMVASPSILQGSVGMIGYGGPIYL